MKLNKVTKHTQISDEVIDKQINEIVDKLNKSLDTIEKNNIVTTKNPANTKLEKDKFYFYKDTKSSSNKLRLKINNDVYEISLTKV